MSIFDFLFYLAIGRLLTWLLQIAGLLKPVWNLHRLLTELSQCDLCLGWWIYLILAVFLPERPFGYFPHWIEIVSLASISTLMAHLLRLGWQSKFGTVVID